MKIKQVKSQRFDLIFILTFFAFYLFLFASLSVMRDSLWRDEAFTAVLIDNSFVDVIKIMAGDFAPFLHPLMIWLSSKIFGNSEIALRALSFICTPFTVFYLRKFFKERIYQNIASILFFSSYLTYHYAAEARYYSLFTFLGLASFHYTLQFFKKGISNKVWWVILSTMLLYTHNIGLFVYASYCLIILINYLKLNKKKLKNLFTAGLPALFFLPWFFILLGQVSSLEDNPFWLSFHPWESLRDGLFNFYFWSKFIYVESIFDLSILQVVVIVALMLATVMGIVTLIKQKKYEFILGGILPLVLVYLLSFKQPLFYIRYIAFSYPFIVIFITMALKKYLNKKVLFWVVAVFLAFNTHLYVKYYHGQSKPEYKLASKYIQNAYDLSKFTVINETEYTYFPCEYYLDGCLIAKKKSDIANVGKVLINEEIALDLKDVADYEEFILISWDPDYDEHHREFRNYIVHQTQIDNLYIYGFHKLGR